MISLNVNGKTMALDVEPDTPLLWALRDFAGLTGTKYGCGGALCGVCTVHIYGRPMRSCVTPVSAAVGRKITTIEAIGATRAGKAVQDALVGEFSGEQIVLGLRAGKYACARSCTTSEVRKQEHLVSWALRTIERTRSSPNQALEPQI
jgi:2Fe-2S iron-sulfur cluster binding domain